MKVVRRLLAGAVIAFAGCGAALAQPPATLPTPPVGISESPVPGGAGLAYDRRGRRDPFEAIDALEAGMTSPTVGSARLTGIVRGRTPHALVETSDGLGYILQVGDMLGDGRLIKIGVNSVVFSVPARLGSNPTRAVLRLPED